MFWRADTSPVHSASSRASQTKNSSSRAGLSPEKLWQTVQQILEYLNKLKTWRFSTSAFFLLNKLITKQHETQLDSTFSWPRYQTSTFYYNSHQMHEVNTCKQVWLYDVRCDQHPYDLDTWCGATCIFGGPGFCGGSITWPSHRRPTFASQFNSCIPLCLNFSEPIQWSFVLNVRKDCSHFVR